MIYYICKIIYTENKSKEVYMRETEITVAVLEGVNDTLDKLKSQGFDLTEKILMTDYYYSKYPDEVLGNFSYEEMIRNSFVLRKVESAVCESQLIYKDKELDENGAVVSEEKIKCSVADFDKTAKVLSAAGLNRWIELKQNMYLFEKEEIVFMVQDVEGLGVFIEYEEDDTMEGLSTYEKIEKMATTLKGLGLKLGDDLSCKKVYLSYLKSHK